MPYTLDTLPDDVVSRLPMRYRSIWLSAFNDAFSQTEDEKKALLAAWGAVSKSDILASVKSAKDLTLIVEGWGMLFTNGENPDLDKEYFNALTQKLLEYYNEAPLWYEHGQDPDYGYEPIGKRFHLEVYPRGIWVEHSLHPKHRNIERTLQEINDGLLGLSSDSMSQYWGQDEKGYNYSWPIAGWSLTKNPAEPALGYVTLKTLEANLNMALAAKAEAREAQGKSLADKQPSTLPNNATKDSIMNEEMLAQLAAFLGLESGDPELLATRLRELASELEGAAVEADGMEEEEIPVESQATLKLGSTIKSALGLNADASMEELADELRAIAVAVKAKKAPEVALNEGALNDFGSAWKAARNQPAQKPLPVKTREQGEDAPAKSRRYGMPHVRAAGGNQLPTVGKMLQEFWANRVHGTPIKSASYQIGSNAGFLLNHEVSNEFIEVLRDKLILTELGADMIPMNGQETLTLPKNKTERTAYWVGEGTTIPESNESLGGVTLYPKPLAARAIVPNKFLANSRINYEQRVQDDVEFQINRALEYAAFFGAGGVTGSNTGIQPAGLSVIAGMTGRSVTKTTLGSGNGAQAKLSDIENMIGRVEDANVQDDGTWGFALSPKSKRYFGNMKDADGNYVLRGRASENIEANFLGYGYKDSNLIPNSVTVGTNSDNTETFFGKWSDLKIGMSNSVEFFIDPYSRSSTMETVIIAHIYADVNVAHDESFEILVHRV